MGRNTRELMLQVRESRKDPEADPAATRLLARKRPSIEQFDGFSGEGETACGGRAGRPGPRHDNRVCVAGAHAVASHFRGEILIKPRFCYTFGQLPGAAPLSAVLSSRTRK